MRIPILVSRLKIRTLIFDHLYDVDFLDSQFVLPLTLSLSDPRSFPLCIKQVIVLRYRRADMLAKLNFIPTQVMDVHFKEVPYLERLCLCAIGKTDILGYYLLECQFFSHVRNL